MSAAKESEGVSCGAEHGAEPFGKESENCSPRKFCSNVTKASKIAQWVKELTMQVLSTRIQSSEDPPEDLILRILPPYTCMVHVHPYMHTTK